MSQFASGSGSSSAASLAGGGAAACINAVKVYDGGFTNDAFGSATPAPGQIQDWIGTHQLPSPGFVDVIAGGGHGSGSPAWTFDQPHPWTAFVAAVRAA